jgi:hypothetical protein
MQILSADILVPSSQFSLSMSPSFAEIEPKDLFELQLIMENVLKNTSRLIHRKSLQPINLHVVIQNFTHVTYNTQNSFVLKTINVTFAIIGTFQEYSVATGPTFMDTLVTITFDRYEYKNLFLNFLHESKHESLHQILAVYLLKLSMNLSDQKPTVTANATVNQSHEILTPVDISLIVVSSLILSCMLLLLVITRFRRPKIITKETAQGLQSRGFSSREDTLSFDDSFPGHQANHSSLAHIPPKKVIAPPFRIFDSSPQIALRKTMSGITVPTSNVSRQIIDSSITMVPLELNTTIDMTPDSSESGELSKLKSTGDLSSALALLPGTFPTPWFDSSHASFSSDSHDLFPSDACNTDDHDGHFSISNSYKGQSMEEWRRSILVVPRTKALKWVTNSGYQVESSCDNSSNGMEVSGMTAI